MSALVSGGRPGKLTCSYRRWEGQRDEFKGRLSGLSQRILELQGTHKRCKKAASDLQVRPLSRRGTYVASRTHIS